MEADNIEYSADFSEQLAERERVRQKIRQAIADGTLNISRLYEAEPTRFSDDPSF